MGKTKIYEGSIIATLTGINNSVEFPVINGFTTINLEFVTIKFEKINCKQCKVSLLINIPKYNNGYKEYIATGYVDDFDNVSFTMNMILDNAPYNLLVTDADFDLKKGKLYAIGLVNKQGNAPQGTLVG
jgi:hypothetical protein